MCTCACACICDLPRRVAYVLVSVRVRVCLHPASIILPSTPAKAPTRFHPRYTSWVHFLRVGDLGKSNRTLSLIFTLVMITVCCFAMPPLYPPGTRRRYDLLLFLEDETVSLLNPREERRNSGSDERMVRINIRVCRPDRTSTIMLDSSDGRWCKQ